MREAFAEPGRRAGVMICVDARFGSEPGTLAALAAVAALGLACTQPDGPAPFAAGAAPPSSCAAPRLILSTPSPSAEALDLWSKEAVGSARAHAALLAACDEARDSARGTEHVACVVLGLAYSAGDGVARDPHQAFAFLERGARCGFDFGAYDLSSAEGQGIMTGFASCCVGRSCAVGCEEECARAVASTAAAIGPALVRACRAGRPSACFMLALATAEADGAGGQYLQTIGSVTIAGAGSRDVLLEKACAGGLGPACERLAFGDEREDPVKRARLMDRACAAGWGGACRHRGKTLDAAGNRAAAIPHYEQACRLGLRTVCSELAEILSKGDGVPVDHERAARVEAMSWRVR